MTNTDLDFPRHYWKNDPDSHGVKRKFGREQINDKKFPNSRKTFVLGNYFFN